MILNLPVPRVGSAITKTDTTLEILSPTPSRSWHFYGCKDSFRQFLGSSLPKLLGG
jgi:hypothetical protein